MRYDERDGRPDGAVAIVRRAPFSDNPRVGARGQRTQQRILDAALRAFGEQGYHGCSIDRITNLARCSRVSFYQYFASKEDVFRQLAGQVARQVSASTEALDPLTPDREGWNAMRAWVARYAEIHARYEPVFHALETDDVLAAVAQRTGEETIARIHARLATTTLPPPAARSGRQAAPRVPEPHARRHRHAPHRRTRWLSGRTRRDRVHRRPASHLVRSECRRERAPAGRTATARHRVRRRRCSPSSGTTAR